MTDEFRRQFNGRLDNKTLIDFVDFLASPKRLNLDLDQKRNFKRDKDQLCDFLEDRGYIDSPQNISTKFKELLSHYKEDDFLNLTSLYEWLEKQIVSETIIIFIFYIIFLDALILILIYFKFLILIFHKNFLLTVIFFFR